jgi:hypothetical protein
MTPKILNEREEPVKKEQVRERKGKENREKGRKHR